MGQHVYFTDKELLAVISSVGEWCEMMGSGDSTFLDVEKRMNDGLGTALYKLYKGRTGQEVYAEYANKSRK